MIGASIVLLSSCAKERPETGPLSSSGFEDPTSRVLAFITTARSVGNGDLKSGEAFSVADAVWAIEAALNYSLGDYSRAYSDLTSDSLLLVIDPQDGHYAGADVYGAFNMAMTVLTPLTNEEQHVILIDVEEPASGSATLKLYYLIGSGYEKADPPNNNYASNDHRWWGYPGSSSGPCNCGGNTNSSARCADKEIEHRINWANTYAIGPNEYLTDVEIWRVNELPTNTAPAFRRYNFRDPLMINGVAPLDDWYRDTRTFSWRNIAPLGGECVLASPQFPEMQHWTGTATNGTWSAVMVIKNLHCPTKLFLNAKAENPWTITIPIGNNPSVKHIGHRWAFTFGRIQSGPNG